MANTIVFFSTDDGDPHSVRIFNEAGVQQGGLITATIGASDTYKYVFTVPALAAGYYTYAGYKDGTKLRSNGEFYWNGTDIVHTEATELTQTQAQAAAAAALAAYGAATATNVTTAQSATAALIAALNNVSTAQIEAALLNDADGQALLAGIAQAVEQAFNNETDGSPTLAAIQGVVTSALNTYDGATQADLDAATAIVQGDIALLNDLSSADISNELAAYDGTTQADLDAAVVILQSGQGMTPAQQTDLTFLKNVAEADEVYGPLKAQKLLKGTATVLVDKDVTTTTECNVNTQLIEAP